MSTFTMCSGVGVGQPVMVRDASLENGYIQTAVFTSGPAVPRHSHSAAVSVPPQMF